MGGTEAVRAKLGRGSQAPSVPVAGLWIQDWDRRARRRLPGKQLWWNWRLDESFYPHWRELVADVESQGGRDALYINPFLPPTNGHDQLFTEAQDEGYLVQKADGSPYLDQEHELLRRHCSISAIPTLAPGSRRSSRRA